MTERPIIVLGCPRSGTTLLQLMLHSHPRIAIPPENRFVLPAYYERASFGDLNDPENRRALARRITRKGTLFPDYGLRRSAVVRRVVAGEPTVGSAVGTVLRAYAEQFDKPRWGDKRPGYVQHIPEILAMFPDARIVQIVRDPRACVASLLRMRWWRQGVPGAVATWSESYDYGRAAEQRLGPEGYFRLRYEDLLDDPESELRALCAFLDEDFDPAMLDPRDTAQVALPLRKTWHDRARTAPVGPSEQTWSETLQPEQLALCEFVLGERMRSDGYEPIGSNRPSLAARAGYARVAAMRRLAHRKRRLQDLWVARRLPNPVADAG